MRWRLAVANVRSPTCLQSSIKPKSNRVLLYFREHSFLVDQIKAKGVRVQYLPKASKIDLGFLMSLIRFLESERFDVIHAYSFTAELWIALARLFANRATLITSIRGKYDEYAPWQWRIKRWVTRQSALVISNSKMAAEFAYERMGLPWDGCTIAYNGVRTPEADLPLPRDLTELQARYAWILTFVGRFGPEKNIPCLMRAARRLQEEGLDRIGIWLVGDGAERQKIEAMADEFDLRHVHLLGERHDVDAILLHTDATVLPSFWEGLSNALLEAMATGKPVIASNVGGSPEIVQHERNGLLFPSDDDRALAEAIKRLADDPAYCSALGSEGKVMIAKRFSIAAMVKQHEGFYSESSVLRDTRLPERSPAEA